jgi:tetratricopeptide (TPR) repeat protein
VKKLALLLLCCACAHRSHGSEGVSWLSLRSDHFLLQTDLPEASAREVVQSLEEARSVMLTVVWPGLAGPAERMRVVMFADAGEVDEVAGRTLGGFFQPVDPFGQGMVVIGGASELGLEIAHHELAHALSHHLLVRQPHWLSEGIASYLANVHLDHGLGRAVVGRLDKDALRQLQTTSSTYQGGVLAMGDGFLQLPDEELSLFENASWVLVHYLIDERREGLNAYAARLAHGEDSQKAFNAQFPDLTEEAIQRAVHDYTHGEGTFQMFTVPLPKTTFAMTVSPLPRAEALALRASTYWPRAPGRAEAIALALQADPANPLALALQGKGDAAAAAKAHPDDWRAFFLLWQAAGELKALEKAALLAPKNPVVLTALSQKRGEAGRRDEALALAVQSVTIAPGTPGALDALARALAAKQRCKEAVFASARSLEVLPDALPPPMLARARERSIDLQSRCGVTPGRVELAEQEGAPDSAPVRQQCGSPPEVSARGTITADYLVREDGSVADVTMSGNASTQALRAYEKFLKSCRYQPAMKDGKPVAMRLRQDLSVHAN